MTFRPFSLDRALSRVGPNPLPHSYFAGLLRGLIFFATLAAIVLALAGVASGPPTFGTPTPYAPAVRLLTPS